MNLDKRVISLIAVGASIAANCQPCLQSTVGQARKAGAEDQEIVEAIEVGRRMREGAAAKMDRFSADLSWTATQSGDAADEVCECK